MLVKLEDRTININDELIRPNPLDFMRIEECEDATSYHYAIRGYGFISDTPVDWTIARLKTYDEAQLVLEKLTNETSLLPFLYRQ